MQKTKDGGRPGWRKRRKTVKSENFLRPGSRTMRAPPMTDNSRETNGEKGCSTNRKPHGDPNRLWREERGGRGWKNNSY
ncbi:hypothetical protein AOLI_G00012760 [Acnodon oligacanthus]